jgi:hypothetical protein
MKKCITLIVTVVVLVTAYPYSAHAIGIALSRQDNPVGIQEPRLSYSSVFNRLVDRMQGVAVFLDTAVAKDRLFNYRLSLDCSSIMTQKDMIFANMSYSINRLTVSNTFGFGFIRTPLIRIWAGPQLALCYEFKNKNSLIFDPRIYNKIGTVVGLNLHTGKDMTLTFEAGFRTGFGFDITKSPSNSLVKSNLEPIASVKLIFRSWDMFSPSGV